LWKTEAIQQVTKIHGLYDGANGLMHDVPVQMAFAAHEAYVTRSIGNCRVQNGDVVIQPVRFQVAPQQFSSYSIRLNAIQPALARESLPDAAGNDPDACSEFHNGKITAQVSLYGANLRTFIRTKEQL
jgi:hypothetical protein